MGEIDIMEHVGFDPGMIHASVHCKKYNHTIGTQKTAITAVPGFASGFHIYALEWNTDSLSIFVDERKYFTFTNEHSGYAGWPFDQPMHLLLNIAIGGGWGGQKGVDDSSFPKQMLVNYVRSLSAKVGLVWGFESGVLESGVNTNDIPTLLVLHCRFQGAPGSTLRETKPK